MCFLFPRRAVSTPLAFVFAVGIGFSASHTARAQTPLFDFTNTNTTYTAGSDSTHGFEFTVTGTQTITGLGLFDLNSDGLANSHDVGLFDNAGNLLVSTTISNALATPVASTASNGRWLERAIAPLVLTNGTYVIGATYVSLDADNFAESSSVSSQAGFVLGADRFLSGSTSLTFPSNSFSGDPATFGPMAFTTPAAVGAPEPGSLSLLGMGLVSGAGTVGAIRRRKGAQPAV